MARGKLAQRPPPDRRERGAKQVPTRALYGQPFRFAIGSGVMYNVSVAFPVVELETADDGCAPLRPIGSR
jgi:hypothetical protein